MQSAERDARVEGRRRGKLSRVDEMEIEMRGASFVEDAPTYLVCRHAPCQHARHCLCDCGQQVELVDDLRRGADTRQKTQGKNQRKERSI